MSKDLVLPTVLRVPPDPADALMVQALFAQRGLRGVDCYRIALCMENCALTEGSTYAVSEANTGPLDPPADQIIWWYYNSAVHGPSITEVGGTVGTTGETYWKDDNAGRESEYDHNRCAPAMPLASETDSSELPY